MSRLHDFRRELQGNRNFSFILGNGINRYAYNGIKEKEDAIPWPILVQNIWNIYSTKKILNIDELDNGISLTELYDVIYLNEDNAPTLKMKDSVVEYFNSHRLNVPETYHKKLQSSLKAWNVPVLTTNFDSNIEVDLQATILRHPINGFRKGFTHYYPWNIVCLPDSHTNTSDLLNQFGVWHINGMLKYKESIRLGLTDYMGQVERARRMINSMKKDGDSPFSRLNMDNWSGYNTWLHILFNTDLCVLGLNLDVNENFLRWLLIERQKYYKRFIDHGITTCKGWYVYSKDDKELSDGKRLFLESVGLKLIELETYKDVYEELLLSGRADLKLI